MIITFSEGTAKAVKAGKRFDVPARTVHPARLGLKGRRYIVADSSRAEDQPL